MTPRLRPARAQDLPAIVAIKQALRLAPGQPPDRGGFLLGCPPDRYAQLIECANVLLLEEAGEVRGFAVTLPDPVLKASDVWERRALIRWDAGESEPPPHEPIAYFDQLALHPAAGRRYAPALALAAVRELARSGHVHLFTTTLAAPVRNAAALPLLRALGMRAVATLEEDYPDVGQILSDLHHAHLPSALARLDATAIGRTTACAAARMLGDLNPAGAAPLRS